jgi:hypothetical protein
MAWSTPLTAVSNASLTAAQWNASLRDNLLETAPAKATTAGSYFVSTGANTIAERVGAPAIVSTSETTTSTTYTDLATNGPAVTTTVSQRALVVVCTQSSNGTALASTRMSFDVSAPTSLAANDNFSLGHSAGANDAILASYVVFITTLTSGSNTFTAKYRVSAGTGTWLNRRILVLPY